MIRSFRGAALCGAVLALAAAAQASTDADFESQLKQVGAVKMPRAAAFRSPPSSARFQDGRESKKRFFVVKETGGPWRGGIRYECQAGLGRKGHNKMSLSTVLQSRDGECVKLAGADFGKADLAGADLRGADLRGANFSGANLDGADLSGADMRGAQLAGASLSEAVLLGADMRGTNLAQTAASGALYGERSTRLPISHHAANKKGMKCLDDSFRDPMPCH
jgi:uncharacterized protein YjbI with pentapeptide repeats